jgi:hypothetical protein
MFNEKDCINSRKMKVEIWATFENMLGFVGAHPFSTSVSFLMFNDYEEKLYPA